MRRRYALAFAPLVALSAAALVQADNWTAFRGPAGNGVSTEKNVPVTWGPDENIRWKTPLPQPGNSSPVVAGDRVFLTCAEDIDGQHRSLYCFNRADGSVRWVRTINFDKKLPTHKTNPYCASTPATDGRRVIVWHGSAGLFCYDLDGSEIWSRDLGEFRHQWGYASSPVIYRDRVFLNAGPGRTVFMGAFDLATGKDLWRVEEPTDGDGQHRGDGKVMGSWSTPIIVNIDGRDQVVCAMPTRVVAYDPQSGQVIWFSEGLRSDKGDLAYSSPVIGDGLCVMIGGFSGAAMGFRLGGTGDITETNRLWRTPRNPQSIGTGIILDGYLYVPDAGPGTIRAIEAATGNVVWTDRAAGANHWGSIVLAEGRMYVTNQQGTTVVFRPNPEKFEPLAMNRLDEPSNATPAISDGQIFLRTDKHLYSIGR